MKRIFIFFVLFSNDLYAQSELSKASVVFDKDTGNLSWVVHNELKVAYKHNCEISNHDASLIHRFMRYIDVFDILNGENSDYSISCGKKGIYIIPNGQYVYNPFGYSRNAKEFPFRIFLNGMEAKILEVVINVDDDWVYNYNLVRSKVDRSMPVRIMGINKNKYNVFSKHQNRFSSEILHSDVKISESYADFIYELDFSLSKEADKINNEIIKKKARDMNNDLFVSYIYILIIWAALIILAYIFYVLARSVLYKVANRVRSYKKGQHQDIIKYDKARPYSVSDEINKWYELKEKGVISGEDFEKVKRKLLDS